MSKVLSFMANWRKWQRVLRRHKGFGLFNSVRFGLWLARGSCAPTSKAKPRDQMYRNAQAA